MEYRKKLSGRPVLKMPKRIKKVDVRFTEEEYGLLMNMVRDLGIGRSELCRNRILGNAASIVTNAKENVRYLDEIGLELSRAGNNVNQLARYTNVLIRNDLFSPVAAERFNLELIKYQVLQKRLEALLRKIIYIQTLPDSIGK